MKYFFLLLLLGVIACSSTEYFNSNGEKLYYNKCSGCHRLYKKDEFTKSKWKDIMVVMKEKAKLSDDETKAILNFLTEK
ncbi:hypothetical protein ABRY23_08635 [Melioribacteraceae bacterium 4301-Me]|uniref:hypothetical protein n=1 Tax=Pyranulibacter aquaticus TaxID=3163344 RepID=UPI0035984BC0